MKSASSLVAGRMFTSLAYLGAWRCLGARRCPTLLGTRKCFRRRQVERNARHDDVRFEEQDPLEEQRRLVVQQRLPPMLRDEFRQHHGDDRIAARRSTPDLLQQRWPKVAEGG